MIKKFSSPKMQNRQFVFTPKIQYKLVAERSEANQNSLTFPVWCGQGESPPASPARPQRLHLAKSGVAARMAGRELQKMRDRGIELLTSVWKTDIIPFN